MKTNVLLSGVVLAGINMILIVPLFACPDPPCDPCWSNWPDCDVYCDGNQNDECCGGECCGHPCCGDDCCHSEDCETCEDEDCVSTCDPGQNCCGGACCDESCCGGDCCDEDNCETCVNDECQVCGGDPDQVCCSGTCKQPCELEEDTTTCSGETQQCPTCGYVCADHYKIKYTGNSIYSCKELGCPGDCQDDDEVVCSTKTRCSQYLIDGSYCNMFILRECLPSALPGSACWRCEIDMLYPPEDVLKPSKKCGS